MHPSLKKFSLSSHYRLKSSKALSSLYKEGRTFSLYPLRVYYAVVEKNNDESILKCAFSVPKRIYKKAVDRNRLKRQMREALRLNKGILLVPDPGQSVHLLIMYFSNEKLKYQIIEKAMKRILKRLVKEVAQSDA
ncbi:MAG: ribonuclease P protein component [Saprospiraceae bacterium]|nr:ribonuclease P protein component [Saprospiraceae bacterium]